ncbi:MAG: hypothetical protein ACM3XN_08450 [Chloroflexota bacterium]
MKRRIAELAAKSVWAMAEGDVIEAEMWLQELADLTGAPAALENLAVCRYHARAYADALETLTPILGTREPLLIGRSLVSLAQRALGDAAAARESLAAAISNLDRAYADAERSVDDNGDLLVGSQLAVQAACELMQYSDALSLYERWPIRGLPGAVLYAGFAAFSLGQYARAIELWSAVAAGPELSDIATGCLVVARLAVAGVIPPFAIDAVIYPEGDEPAESPVGSVETPNGTLPVLTVDQCLHLADLMQLEEDPLFSEPGILPAAEFLDYTGDWGLALAERSLQAPQVPLPVKLGALSTLAAAGRLRAGDPVTLVGRKRSWHLTYGSLDVPDEQPAVRKAYERAVALARQDGYEEAYRRLERLCRREWLYPPAMVALATLMRHRGEYIPSMLLLHAVEAIAPNHNLVLFNLAATFRYGGDIPEARRYLSRITTTGENREFRWLVAELRRSLRGGFDQPLQAEIDEYAELARGEQDDKPIALGLTLTRALKRLPFRWLNAVARVHGITDIRRRPAREAALAAALLDGEKLTGTLAKAPADVLALLRTVLSAGGWCRLNRLERAFGSQDYDGMWVDGPPTSTIGMARYFGLLYVGRALIGGKRQPVAVVPIELRQPLEQALGLSVSTGDESASGGATARAKKVPASRLRRSQRAQLPLRRNPPGVGPVGAPEGGRR